MQLAVEGDTAAQGLDVTFGQVRFRRALAAAEEEAQALPLQETLDHHAGCRAGVGQALGAGGQPAREFCSGARLLVDQVQQAVQERQGLVGGAAHHEAGLVHMAEGEAVAVRTENTQDIGRVAETEVVAVGAGRVLIGKHLEFVLVKFAAFGDAGDLHPYAGREILGGSAQRRQRQGKGQNHFFHGHSVFGTGA